MAGKDNLDPIRSKEVARERQKLSAAKRSQNVKERKLIREMLEDKLRAKGYSDLDEALEKFIERMKEKDESLKLGLQIMGEDPGETVNIGQTEPFKIEVEIERV